MVSRNGFTSMRADTLIDLNLNLVLHGKQCVQLRHAHIYIYIYIYSSHRGTCCVHYASRDLSRLSGLDILDKHGDTVR